MTFTVAGAELQRLVDDLHRRVLAGLVDGVDAVSAGRRRIVERHRPDTVTGRWAGCDGPHGREGGEYAWPCDDYRDAAAEAGDVLSEPDADPRDMRFPEGRPDWLGEWQPWPCGRCGSEEDRNAKHDCRPRVDSPE